MSDTKMHFMTAQEKIDPADICEKAHKLTVRDCAKKKIKIDCSGCEECDPKEMTHYTDEAQEIFNSYYDEIKSMEIFTPVEHKSGIRLQLNKRDVRVVSGELGLRGRGKHAVVEIKGKRYDVIGKACSEPHCMCDAYIKEL